MVRPINKWWRSTAGQPSCDQPQEGEKADLADAILVDERSAMPASLDSLNDQRVGTSIRSHSLGAVSMISGTGDPNVNDTTVTGSAARTRSLRSRRHLPTATHQELSNWQRA